MTTLNPNRKHTDTMSNTKAMLTTREACEYLGRSRKTLFNWMNNGTATPDQTGDGPTDAHWWSVDTLDRIADSKGFTPAGRQS